MISSQSSTDVIPHEADDMHAKLHLMVLVTICLQTGEVRLDGTGNEDFQELNNSENVLDGINLYLKSTEARSNETTDDDNDSYDDDDNFDDDDDDGDDEYENDGENKSISGLREQVIKSPDASCAPPPSGETKNRLHRRPIKNFLAQHNSVRRMEAKTYNYCNMWSLKWDGQLARMAQKTADSCHFQHYNVLRDGVDIGQNLYLFKGSKQRKIKGVVNKWYYEFLKPSGPQGHYHQVVTGAARYIGCAMARCENACLPAKNATSFTDTRLLTGKFWYYVCDYDKITADNEPDLTLTENCSCCSKDPDVFYTCSDDLCVSCKNGTEGCRSYVVPDNEGWYQELAGCVNAGGDAWCKRSKRDCQSVLMMAGCRKRCDPVCQPPEKRNVNNIAQRRKTVLLP
ncbi:hypothetical protein ScPMuIL_015450 [Solemya velum]